MAKKPTPQERQESAVRLAVAILKAPAGVDAQRNELLSVCVWKWTEAHGKYNGCRFWTRAALEAPSHRDLAHEHVVPRQQVVQQLCAQADPNEESVRELFEAVAVACVVTRAEHSDLPDVAWEVLSRDPWTRYRQAQIEVVDTWSEAA